MNKFVFSHFYIIFIKSNNCFLVKIHFIKQFIFFCVQDLNNETINHLDAENRRQTLEEELEFQKDVHAQVSEFLNHLNPDKIGHIPKVVSTMKEEIFYWP